MCLELLLSFGPVALQSPAAVLGTPIRPPSYHRGYSGGKNRADHDFGKAYILGHQAISFYGDSTKFISVKACI